MIAVAFALIALTISSAFRTVRTKDEVRTVQVTYQQSLLQDKQAGNSEDTMNGQPKNGHRWGEIQELRKKLSDVLKPQHSDDFLMRWYRAKNFDMGKTVRVIRMCLRSRASYQIDDLPRTYHLTELCRKHAFTGFFGFDKGGVPIRYLVAGTGDFDGFIRSLSIYDICLFCAYYVESDMVAMRENDKKMGRKREGELFAIFDMEGFNLQQIAHKHVIETGLDLMQIFQEYNPPELLKRLLIINAPIYFSMVYNIFKPIVRLNMLEKIEVHSRDSSPAALLKYIDADVLPQFLGGNRVDENGDPRCSAIISSGGKIPETHYLKNQPLLSPKSPGVLDVTIAAKSIYDYPVDVPEAGMRIHVEFWTDDSVYLHVVYKKGKEAEDILNGNTVNSSMPYEDDEEMVSPVARIQSQISRVDNWMYCERKGTYIFRFDNTCSWWYSRRLVHRIEAVPQT